MKTDFGPMKKTSIAEILLTVLVFGWGVVSLVGGMHLIGITQIPARALPYIGGALIAYVIVTGAVVTLMCVKFMLKKG